MRNFRTFVNDPAGNDPAATDYLGATNINNFLGEAENMVSRSGQSLSTDDGTSDSNQLQMAESAFLHGVKSQGFVDSGSANTYEVTPISGASGVKIPADYANMDGATIWFTPSNDSTSDSTLNIGQTSGSLLGSKKLLNNDGSAISTEITTSGPVEVRYDASADSSNGAWLLQPWSASTSTSVAFEYIIIEDQKSSGTNGGTFTNGAWRTRDLNTVIANTITGASLSSNQITLPAGTYKVDASAPAQQVDTHKAALYDTTASAFLCMGTTEYCANGQGVQTRSFLSDYFTLATTSVLELQHICELTRSTDGFGRLDVGLGTYEVYSKITIQKVA